MPDARKALSVLNNEWTNCTDCSLGDHRVINEGQMVFGEGARRGILFVGEGPEKDEEAAGHPICGSNGGQILRRLLKKFRVEHVSYLTNLVLCRSCSVVLGEDGQPRMNTYRNISRPMFKDEPPLPIQMNACRARLLEEIYIVDPVVIVSLGPRAAEALTQRPMTIGTKRGQEVHIEIPGAGHVASLTEIKKQWVRKSGGKLTLPTEQNMVRYLLIPTLPPFFIKKKIDTIGDLTPLKDFASDVLKGVRIYERYMEMLHGVVPSPHNDIEEEVSELTRDIEEDNAENDE